MASWVHKAVERLVEQGEVSPDDVISAVSAQQEHRIPFVEVLVLQGKLTEKRLLGELARDRGVPVITSAELCKLPVERTVLERLPVREAEAMCVLPIRYDAKKRKLVVAVQSLDSVLLERLTRSADAESVSPVLSTTFTIRAGIKRFYYRDKDSFAALANLALEVTHGAGECPNCGVPVPPGALQCSKCGLLGKPTAKRERPLDADSSVVRALLSPDTAPTAPHGVRLPDGLPATIQFSPQALLNETVVPTLVAELDAALATLQPFEAHVASFVDGSSTVVEIAQAAKISAVEVCIILRALEAKRAVCLDAPPDLGEEPRTEPSTGLMALLSKQTEPGYPPHEAKAPRKMESTTVIEGSRGVLQRAVALELAGKIDQAIAVLEEAIARNRSAVLMNRLALIVLIQREDAGKAVELLRRAVELEPGNKAYEANLYSVLALSMRRQGAGDKRRGFLSRLLGQGHPKD